MVEKDANFATLSFFSVILKLMRKLKIYYFCHNYGIIIIISIYLLLSTVLNFAKNDIFENYEKYNTIVSFANNENVDKAFLYNIRSKILISYKAITR